MDAAQRMPVSRHFRLEQLAEGVYAAIHRDGGWAICNAGIVDLGDRTLIFDTTYSPQAGADLRTAAETLFGRPVGIAINSHWHSDHIWGNQAFDRATEIVSSVATRRRISATRGDPDYDETLATAETRLASVRARYAAAEDEGQRREVAIWVDEWEATVALKDLLQVRVPDLAFTDRIAIHGSARNAELIDYAGHTDSDAVLTLPDDGIAFMGDLLFVECHPYLGDGDPDGLRHALDEVSALVPSTVVPGHGAVGTADSLKAMRLYVDTLEELARQMVAHGEPEEVAAKVPIPAPFEAWTIKAFFAANLRFLLRRVLAGLGG
jgi:glyoxylase-like metal-dependent hydrolase (beta-lactamase superfamily II)